MNTQRIYLTGDTDIDSLEIYTVAGIVHVSTGLEDTVTRQAVVMVQIEPNDQSGARTPDGGVWDTEVREVFGGRRTDIRLTRQER